MRKPKSARPRWRSADGAVLVHIAVAIIGLLAFCVLTIDYGVLWASRRQAQNAADAAALAGALTLTYDNLGYDRARLVAKQVGESHTVFGGSLSITQGTGPGGTVTDDISFVCPPGEAGPCIRVNVYRNQARGNPLPVFFGPVAGITAHGVQATATAIVAGGNATQCMRPFGLMDKWDEAIGSELDTGALQTPDPYNRSPGWDPDFYDLLPPSGPDPARMREFNPGTDSYTPPSSGSPGTGFRLYAPDGRYCCDYGELLRVRICSPGQNGGCYQPIDCGPNRCFVDQIAQCNGQLRILGESLALNQEGLGVRNFIEDGVNALIARDSGARWYGPGARADCPDGCIYSPETGVNASPRMVPVPVFNSEVWANDTGRTHMNIQNFIGVFVEGVDNHGPRSQIRLRLVPAPGIIAGGAGSVDGESTFLRTVILIR